MDNRYRDKNFQQDYRDRYARRGQQDEQFSADRDEQYGDGGWRTQEGERWQSGVDFDRGYGRYEPSSLNDWNRTESGYRSDTSSLDDYDRQTPASRYGREAGTRYTSPPRDRFASADRFATSRNTTGFGERSYGGSTFGSGSYGSIPPRQYDRDERGFFDRASDEVMSWFGDDDATRRRQLDHREDHRGKGPAGYTRSSERLLEDANERLMRDSSVDASKITVTCEGNAITLTGTVDSRAAKRRAEDIVDDISGVKHVQNNLRVESRDSYYSETSTLSDS